MKLIIKNNNSKRRLQNNDHFISQVMRNGGKPKLEEIEIETVNRCNGVCPFCPVNVNEPQRPYAKMTEQLFFKIIEQLSEINYDGKISLFSNNEPFLDERIVSFYKFTREKLPKAFIGLYTNGSLLTVQKFNEVINYVDKFVIDNYNDNHDVNNSLKEIYNVIQNNRFLQKKVVFEFRKQNEILLSRGGQAPNKKNIKGINEKCLLPFRMMIIRPSGEVSLCCNDALGKYTLGDVNKDSIMNIWDSEEYFEIRNEIYKNGRKNLKLCKNCDSPTKLFRKNIFGKTDYWH